MTIEESSLYNLHATAECISCLLKPAVYVCLVCWSLISHFLGLWRRPRLLLHFSREIKSRFRNPKFPPDLLVAALMYYISLHFTSFHRSLRCLRGVQSISCFSWSKLTRRWVCMQKAMRGRDHSQISKRHHWGGGGAAGGGGGGGGGGRGHRWWGGAEFDWFSLKVNKVL